ncbi:MAG TPA: hypothetical protein VF941_09920 [Clostridia bacterium]
MKSMILLLNTVIAIVVLLLILRVKFFHRFCVKWPLFIYFALILAVIPVLYAVPKEGLLRTVPASEINGLLFRENAFENLGKKNKPEEVPWLHLCYNKEIKYSKNKIEIKDIDSNTRIFVKRKDNDEIIRLKYYIIKTYVDNIDVTDKIIPTEIKLENGSLSEKFIANSFIELSRFKKDFSVSQFTGNEGYKGLMFTPGIGAVLYLELPKTLLVESKEKPVVFVD